MDEMAFSLMCKQLAPPLVNSKYKGQAGKIGVVGGSLEYTGAPYFAGISSLKVGADLVSVFCPRDAGVAIKSYSPELMVYPILGEDDFIVKLEQPFRKLHVIVIGPGMGRDNGTFEVFEKVMSLCKRLEKPLVLDADALYFVALKPGIINDYPSPGIILTPNAMELSRLMGLDSPVSTTTTATTTTSTNRINNNYTTTEDQTDRPSELTKLFEQWGKTVTLLCKGAVDRITDYERTVKVAGGGSGRRCGGQGDLLSGSLATFYAWALQHKIDIDMPHDDRPSLACYAACRLTRECNARAFKKHGRSMTTTDMICEIHDVFEDHFELK